jgi:hypothetical protein
MNIQVAPGNGTQICDVAPSQSNRKFLPSHLLIDGTWLIEQEEKK